MTILSVFLIFDKDTKIIIKIIFALFFIALIVLNVWSYMYALTLEFKISITYPISASIGIIMGLVLYFVFRKEFIKQIE